MKPLRFSGFPLLFFLSPKEKRLEGQGSADGVGVKFHMFPVNWSCLLLNFEKTKKG